MFAGRTLASELVGSADSPWWQRFGTEEEGVPEVRAARDEDAPEEADDEEEDDEDDEEEDEDFEEEDLEDEDLEEEDFDDEDFDDEDFDDLDDEDFEDLDDDDEDLDVVAATQDLVGAEIELVNKQARETVMRRALRDLRDQYQFVIIDCPPSLGLLTLNMLTAADSVLIPIQCEYYALEGLSQLLNTIKLVQRNFNAALAIDGALLTMYDARLNLSKQVADEAKEYFGSQMFGITIPRNVRLAEAPSFGKPILLYDVQSVGAKSYLAVAQELIRRVEHGGVAASSAASPAPPAAEPLPEVPA